MKPFLPHAILFSLPAIILFQVPSSFAQGSLTPPGPPAPTLKTLDQVEPRIPVDAVHTPGNGNNVFIINQSGSYYLTTNIVGVASKNGISIQADNVTLDLKGFTLFGSVTNSQAGILVSGPHVGITIRNGRVRDWGINGIGALNAAESNFEDLKALANTTVGIKVGSRNTLRNCWALDNGTDGITTGDNCQLAQCTMTGNGLSGAILGSACSVLGGLAATNDLNAVSTPGFTLATGNGCTVKDFIVVADQFGVGIATGNSCSVIHCTVSACTYDTGIETGTNCTVLGCLASANGAGILTGGGCTIQDCTANTNSSGGITVGNESTIIGCTCAGNSAQGIVGGGTTGGLAKNCLCSQNGFGGMNFSSGWRIQDCRLMANSGPGLNLNNYCDVTGCLIQNNTNHGIVCASACRLAENTIMGNRDAAINALGYGNRIDSNHLRDNGTGIVVFQSNGFNVVVRNTAGNNTGGNYQIASGNPAGAIASDPTAANAWANFQN